MELNQVKSSKKKKNQKRNKVHFNMLFEWAMLQENGKFRYHINSWRVYSVSVVKSHFKTVKNGASGFGNSGRIESMVRIQRHWRPAIGWVITVHEYKALHVIKRVAILLSHQELSVPSEFLKLRIHYPYPPHLITNKQP